MATFKCPDCKGTVSTAAEVCPKCGRPVTEADRKPKPYFKGLGLLKWVVICFVALLLFVGIFNSTKTPEEKAQLVAQQEQTRKANTHAKEAKEKPFADALLEAGKAAPKKYGAYVVEVNNLSDVKCLGSITYDKGPMAASEAQAISEAAVKGLLKVFMTQGKKPSQDGVSVTVRVYTKAKGETGSDKVAAYGVARYLWGSDSIEWKREQ